MKYRLQLPTPPSANRWWRNVGGRMVLSRAARAYKITAANAARVQLRALRVALPVFAAKRPVALRVVWTREAKRGDLDKRLGVVLDALQGVLYANDGQLTQLHAYRADDGEPGVQITAWPA